MKTLESLRLKIKNVLMVRIVITKTLYDAVKMTMVVVKDATLMGARNATFVVGKENNENNKRF